MAISGRIGAGYCCFPVVSPLKRECAALVVALVDGRARHMVLKTGS